MKASKLSLVALLALGMMVPAAIAMNGDDQTNKSDKQAQKEDKGEKKDKKEKKDEKKGEGVAVGSIAPGFTLTDTDGKSVNLADYAGKVVVLQWFNPGCPFVVKHYKGANTFNDLYTKYTEKGVVFLAINSGAAGKEGAGKETNATAKKDWKIEYPVLLDEAGTVGKTYGAQRTPEMYIIDKDGKVVYHGAIDDESGMKGVGKTNYVAKALDEVLAGKPVTTAQTKPYGCTVKYGK